jgi:hypothetical protein
MFINNKSCKTKEEMNIDIEIIINQGLYDKKIITSEMYNKVNEKLLKLKNKNKNKYANTT